MDASNGTFTEYNLPGITIPVSTLSGAEGNVGFAAEGGAVVGKIEPATTAITEYPIPSGHSPITLITGPDNNIWFSEVYKGVGTIVPATGAITEYATPSASMGGAFGL